MNSALLNREERMIALRQKVRRSFFAREMYALGGIYRVLKDATRRINDRVKAQESVVYRVGQVYNGKMLEMRRIEEGMTARLRLGLENGLAAHERYIKKVQEAEQAERELTKEKNALFHYRETAARFDFLFSQWPIIAHDARAGGSKTASEKGFGPKSEGYLIKYRDDFEAMGEAIVDLDVPAKMYRDESRRMGEEEKVEREDLDEGE